MTNHHLKKETTSKIICPIYVALADFENLSQRCNFGQFLEMKPMKYLFIVLTTGRLFGLNSCGYVERDFLGKWQVYDLELQSEWRGNIVDEEMREYYKNVHYEFLQEGKMIYHEFENEAEGEWSLKDGESLMMNYDLSYSTYGRHRYISEDLNCKILSVTAGKMALQMKFQENETWVFYLKELDK